MLKGIVYLVGAGPGDPSLITLKGIECLKQANIVIYDYLANRALLRYVSPKARKIYVGKKGASHAREQENINQLLIREAKKGKKVVRLKGGDPFIFGRGGEEAEALVEAGLSFEIVPGVTSAIAVPAYAGIPLTHRDFTSSVAFITGHEKDDTGAHPPDWNAFVKVGTLVFLMSYANLPRIVEGLLKAGRDPKTPAAVIEWGTLPRQKTAEGTLRTILDEVKKKDIRPPTIVVMGDVVSLRKKIGWFEKKPLFGKKILVTRSREQASLLTQGLTEQGASVIELPTLELQPPTRWTAVDKAIKNLSRFDWLLFTSANGVEYFFQRLAHLKKDLRSFGSLKIAVVGPSTARPLRERGIQVDLIADEYRGEGLLKKLASQKVRGRRVLLPQAKNAHPLLREGLKALGAKVEVVEAYRSVKPKKSEQALRELLEKEKIDVLTFASSATIENFAQLLGKSKKQSDVFQIPAACIGPITAETARRKGFTQVIEPKKSSMPDLIDAIVTFIKE